MLVLAALLLAAATSAAPAPHEARYNQPHAPVDLNLHHLSSRANHPDPAVRAAFIRDEMITNRIRFARALDTDGHVRLQRDLEFVADSQRRRALRKRQVGPQNSSPDEVTVHDTPGQESEGGSTATTGAPAVDISLMDYNRDQGYATPVSVGTPPQEFLVVADTGSQDFVLFGTDCDDCNGHPTFDESASTTFRRTTTPMYEAYGTGEASGYWALDRVAMGGYFVNDQPIALVTNGSVAQYMGSELSGIMGLGVPSISLQGPNGPAMEAPPMFWMTVAEEVWEDQEFGVYLERVNTDPSQYVLNSALREETREGSGVLTLGGLNRSLFTGDVHYMDANTTYWWQLPLESFSANGKKFNAKGAPTIIDTGSTAIMMPDAAVKAFHAQIPGAQEPQDGTWVIPCNTTATASFWFDGVEYPVQTADLLRGALGSDPQYCLSTVGPGAWLLGAAFMKNVYTAFRLDPPQVGFASLDKSIVKNGKYGSTNTVSASENQGQGSSSTQSAAGSVRVSAGVLALSVLASVLLH